MTGRIEVGDLVEVTAAFTDPDSGAALDPDAVFLDVQDPAGAVTTWAFGVDPEIEQTGTGGYRAYVDVTAAGAWAYRWYATGNGQASESAGFTAKTPKTT